MDYKKLYASKLCTAKEAVKDVTSGDWVDYGWCTGHPVALDKALAERMPELEDVKIRGGIALWRPAIFDIENPADHFCWNSWHMSGIERKAVNEGFAFYAPIRYSELPRYYAENVEPIHVAMFQVAPMDEHGFFNFGPSASHMASMCKRAQIIVVEVNQNMPRCLGGFNEGIHISQVTHIVEGDNPPIAEMGASKATAVDEAVAKLIVEEIPNGMQIVAPFHIITDRSGALDVGTITIEFTAIRKDVISVRSWHFEGYQRKEPRFELNKDMQDVDVEITDEKAIMTAGRMQVCVDRKDFKIEYKADGKVLTTCGIQKYRIYAV